LTPSKGYDGMHYIIHPEYVEWLIAYIEELEKENKDLRWERDGMANAIDVQHHKILTLEAALAKTETMLRHVDQMVKYLTSNSIQSFMRRGIHTNGFDILQQRRR